VWLLRGHWLLSKSEGWSKPILDQDKEKGANWHRSLFLLFMQQGYTNKEIEAFHLASLGLDHSVGEGTPMRGENRSSTSCRVRSSLLRREAHRPFTSLQIIAWNLD
jgi:hypothetical protein